MPSAARRAVERRSTGAPSARPRGAELGVEHARRRARRRRSRRARRCAAAPARCQTTWTVATAPRSSSSVSASTSSISLAGGPVGAGERHVGAGRRDAHRRPGDRLHEIDAVARALEHLAAAGGLVGEPRAAGGRAEHAHGERARAARSANSSRTCGDPRRSRATGSRSRTRRRVRSAAVDDRAARRRGRARPASRGRPGARARAPRPSPRGAAAAACSTSTASGSPALEQRLPSRRTPRLRSRRGPGQPLRVGIADARDLLAERAQALQMRLRDPAAADQADPHATTSPFLQHGARTPAHLGSVPHARVEPLGERLRRERPRRLADPTRGGRPARPPRRRARRTGDCVGELERQAPVAQAAVSISGMRAATPGPPETISSNGDGRARAAVRVIGADRASACRRARPPRRPRRARAGAAAARSRPSRRPARRRRESSSSRYCGQVSPITSSPSARAPADRRHAAGGRDVDDVDGRPGEAREVERAADALLLDERRARARVRVDAEVAGRAQALAQHLDRRRAFSQCSRGIDAVLAAPQERAQEHLVVGVHAELAVGEEELDAAHALSRERRERGLVERVRLVHRRERLDAAGRAGGQRVPARAGVLDALAGLGRRVGLDRRSCPSAARRAGAAARPS